jgi:hypothetical protein
MAATQCNKTDGVDKSSCKASNIRKNDIFCLKPKIVFFLTQ